MPLSRIFNELCLGFVPALVFGVVAYTLAAEETDTMSEIVFPTVAFALGLVSVVIFREIIPFLWRAIRGKPARGQPRTLRDYDTTAIEAQLRTEKLPNLSTVAYRN